MQIVRPDASRERSCSLSSEHLFLIHHNISLKIAERRHCCGSHSCVHSTFFLLSRSQKVTSVSRLTVHSPARSDRSEIGGKLFQRLGLFSPSTLPVSLPFFGFQQIPQEDANKKGKWTDKTVYGHVWMCMCVSAHSHIRSVWNSWSNRKVRKWHHWD